MKKSNLTLKIFHLAADLWDRETYLSETFLLSHLAAILLSNLLSSHPRPLGQLSKFNK